MLARNLNENPGISWAGTAEEDAAYRTSVYGTGVWGKSTAQGFNLSQWFTDQGIDGDHSYYRYAQIRGLGDAGFRAGAGNVDIGTSFGRNEIQDLYQYSGSQPADTVPVAAQNITTLTAKGLDTWGRPLPAGFKTPEQAAAKRLAGVTGGMSGGDGGPGMLSTDTMIGSELTLSKDETLGNK
jgi:hypothetical protein